MKHIDIYNKLQEWCPTSSMCEGDNAGFLVGNKLDTTTKVLVCLDITTPIIDRAIEIGANLIVTHHPIIWAPLKNVTDSSRVYKLIKNGISVISCHTNLDMAKGGVNDTLAKALCLKNIKPLYNDEIGFNSAFGELENEQTVEEFTQFVKQKLNTNLRYCKGKTKIKKVAVCGGAGSDMLVPALLNNCDALVTADLKHSMFITAFEKGITLIDAGHYHTENIIIKPLADYIASLNIEVYTSDFSPVNIL
jgi:dinuclear metal center YbgI/SA1388 family protein